ncbi:hypothetical protein DERF_007029 [Dermatophagoides farinae]|uniref:Uncharacterized protein n=1 Tax=Dermatophagoides farinae TaxID=6954 RepID=A0A922HXC4_DERFA|nr:hypothetical protein DERF_007029 [Dermatophagoides farinae]
MINKLVFITKNSMIHTRLLLTKEVRLPVLIIALTIRFDPMFRDDVSSVCSSTFCSIDSSTSLFLHTVEGWDSYAFRDIELVVVDDMIMDRFQMPTIIH